MRATGKKDAFQARLDRIRDERDDPANAAGPIVSRDQAPSSQAPRRSKVKGGGNGFLTLGLVVLVCALGGGAYGLKKAIDATDMSFGQFAKETLLDAVTTKPTADSFDGLKDSGPKKRKQYDTGWVLPTSYVAAPGRSDLTMDAVAVSATHDPEEAPAGVTRFANNEACTLRKPRENEVVHNVNFDNTARYSDTHAFSKAELAKAVVDRVVGITAHKRHYKNASIAKGRMGQVDVYVTATDAPVYLVLQVFNRDVLWNIHLAEGVTLAHVAMIGNKSGFAAPKGEYTYEALRISDFVSKGGMYDTAVARPCMIAPWRAIDEDWPLLSKQNDQHSASIYQKQLLAHQTGYASYNTWYHDQLGVPADTNLTTALIAAHAVVGPVPSAPLTRAPLRAQHLYMAQSDYVAFGPAELEALHVDLLTAAAGGDLAALKPGVMEEVIQ